MKKLVIIMMMVVTVGLVGCNTADEAMAIDDVEYIAIDSETGEIVLTPVTLEDIEAKKVTVLTKEDLEALKKGNKEKEVDKAAVVKAALLNK